MNRLPTCARIVVILAIALAPPSAEAATIDWTTVSTPGNSPDSTHFGAVGYTYRIAKYDVTNSQYAEFLNAKDPTGANSLGLYNSPQMGFGDNLDFNGWINFNNGATDGSKYSAASGHGNQPINNVTYYDAIRFANWVNNGQGNGDTESGAYTLVGGTPTPSNIVTVRDAGANVFLPNENEWYKAAYYDPRTTAQGGPPADSHYWLYPTANNVAPVAEPPPGGTNSANYGVTLNGHPTDVGAYLASASPFGTFDQGGNLGQYVERSLPVAGHSDFIVRGGAWTSSSFLLESTFRSVFANEPNNGIVPVIGFRLASVVPEPSSLMLAVFGFIGLVAWGWRKKTSSRRMA